jgi:AraC-like DNA-binding protein
LRHLRIARSAPASDLAEVVECHWEVVWDLPPGRTHRQRNLSHASVTLAWESDGAWIYGVPGKVFDREVWGSGRVFGVKFRPGGARAFFPSLVVADLTGSRHPLLEILPRHDLELRTLEGARDFAERVERANKFCRSLRQGREAPASIGLTAPLESDRSILRVETLSERAGLPVRELQRLFRLEVGLTPKETIRRFRLQQAADRFHGDPDISCLELAMELGYFDQAHFARDFRAVVGASPDAYRKRVRQAKTIDGVDGP